MPENRNLAWGGTGGDGSSAVVGFGAQGLPVFDARFYGAAGDGVTNDAGALQAAIDGIPISGGILMLSPPGPYKINTGLLIDNKPVHFLGSVSANSIPGPANASGTKIIAAAGITALEIRNGTNGYGGRSIIENLHLLGSDSSPGSNDGIRLRANGAAIIGCKVEAFGGNGIHVLSGQDGSPFVGDGTRNANCWYIERTRVANCKTNGLFVEGIDSNAGTCVGLDSSNNTGWGIYDNSAFGNVYLSPQLQSSTAGAIRIGVQSGFNRFLGVYKEGDSTPALQIDAGGDEGNIVDFRVFVGNAGETIVDNTAGKKNTITKNGQVPFVRATKAALQSIANNSLVKVVFDTERVKTEAALHDNVTNNTRFTCVTPGFYKITAQGQIAANGVGVRYGYILLNNATTIAQVAAIGTAADDTYLNPSTEYFLGPGDFVEFQVYQNSGGALNLLKNANYGPELTMSRIGP